MWGEGTRRVGAHCIHSADIVFHTMGGGENESPMVFILPHIFIPHDFTGGVSNLSQFESETYPNLRKGRRVLIAGTKGGGLIGGIYL